jgi:cytidyltransferase-like protein
MNKMIKIMCFGTFDLLHLGHLNYFKQAKKFGTHLTVVIARDKTKQDQEKDVAFSENERLELIDSLEIVDEVVLGHEGNHFKIIQEKVPDIICLGYDHKVEIDDLKIQLSNLGLNPKILRMKPYLENKHKSSKIKKIVLKNV